MNLYLDDDSVDKVLVRLLIAGGHDVLRPNDIGTSGDPDAVHLRRAIHLQRVLITQNHDDFADLHDLVVDSGGHHPGILVVRRDNDPRRDLSPRGLVNALRKFLKSGLEAKDALHVLNHWR